MGPNTVQMGGVAPDGSSDVGDVIISSGADKPKASRKLVLGVVLGVLVLIFGSVGAVFLLNQGGGGVFGGKQTMPEVVTKFNTFANYMLYGQEKADNVSGQVGYSDGFKIVEMTEAGRAGGGEEYFEKLLELYANFEDVFEDELDYDKYWSLLVDYKGELSALKAYVDWNQSENDLLDLYVASGNDLGKAEEVLGVKYDNYEGVSELSSYAEVALKLGRLELERIDAYNGAGCIADGKINATCAKTKVNFDAGKTSEIESLKVEAEQKMKEILKRAVEEYNDVAKVVEESV